MAILAFFTACPSPPKAPAKVTPLGTTLPAVSSPSPSAEATESGGARNTGQIPQVSSPIPSTGTTEPREVLQIPTQAASPSPIEFNSNQWLSLENWSRSKGLEAPRRFDNGWGPTFQSRSSNGVLSITMGSRVAYWNGLALAFGFVPHLTNGLPFLHALDLIKNVAPLVSLPGLKFQRGRVVVIDPGHGGEETGAKSAVNKGFEKDFTLDWAIRAKPLLNSMGWKVLLTRAIDEDLPLSERVRIAERANADLFISLHFNSVDSPKARPDHGGVETYCLTPTGMPSNLVRDFKDDPSLAFPNNGFDEQNLQFAVRMHQAMVRITERRDRGIKRARFMTVLRGQNRPAVLLEGGYLSDPEEALLIASGAYRQKLAVAVAKALE